MLLISLFLTALAYYYVSQNVEAQTRARFDDTTRAIQEAIEGRTRAYLDAMYGARGLFCASESVTRGEWDTYVQGIEPDKRFKGLQALSYAQRVDRRGGRFTSVGRWRRTCTRCKPISFQAGSVVYTSP